MSEENLSDLLESAADRHVVGSPPLDQMLARSRRARKRRAGFMVLAASVVIGSVIAGTTLLFSPDDPASNPADSLPSAGAVDLEGDWVLTALTDPDGKALLSSEPGSMDRTIRLNFEGGLMRAVVVDCSELTASYEQSGDRDISFAIKSEMNLKPADCDPPVVGDRLRAVRHVSESNGVVSLHAESWMIVAQLQRVAAPGNPPELPCSASEQLRADLDVQGPGRPTQAEAVAPYADGNRIVVDGSDPAVVYVVDADGTATRIFKVSQQSDGWWPDSYVECRASSGDARATIATYEPTGANSQALTSGTLTVSNGCVVLGNGADAQLILFDATNTTFTGRTLNTTDEQGNSVSVAVGDEVSFAGGNGPVPKDRAGVSIPAACEGAAAKEAFYTYGVARGTGTPTADVAVWSLAPDQNLDASSTEFTALVSRLGCNSGVTGEVSEPSVTFTGTTVSVSFTVPHSSGGFCPGNDAVPVTVRLSEPLGDRDLVDGQCRSTRANSTLFCESDHGVRWSGN